VKRWTWLAADVPTVAPGVDVLAGIAEIPQRMRGNDYRRAAFGDTRNDVLDRDLLDKTYTSITRCPTAVATGTLHDPYTNAVVAFTRGNQVGASVQIDHLLSAAVMPWAAIDVGQCVEDMPLTGRGHGCDEFGPRE
jgi:hypothetical protein